MTISPSGISVIIHFENFEPTAYQDDVGIWTIGYGTTRVNGRSVRQGMSCTEPQARQWLLEHANQDVPKILRLCRRVITQSELDALVSFAYNLGIENFRTSYLLKNIQASRPVTESNFTSWNKARIKGVLTPLNGLTRRRKSEYVLFTTGRVQFTF